MATWTISRRAAGERLVNFVQTQLGEAWSRRKVKAAIDRYRCRVNGRVESRASYTLVAGDIVDFECDAADVATIRDWFLDPKSLLFEDDALLVFNKPVGVVSDDEALLARLRQRWPEVELVHRLDKPTTGVWVLAKDEATAEALKARFRERAVEKRYLAVVDGVPQKKEGVVEIPIRRVGRGQRNEWRAEKHSDARRAVTRWRVENSGGGMALVVCSPETGRTHQIRLHMKAIDHPVLGDYQYTPEFFCSYRPPRCLLHAQRIAFEHPSTKKTVTVEAPVPDDIAEAVAAMGEGAS